MMLFPAQKELHSLLNRNVRIISIQIFISNYLWLWPNHSPWKMLKCFWMNLRERMWKVKQYFFHVEPIFSNNINVIITSLLLSIIIMRMKMWKANISPVSTPSPRRLFDVYLISSWWGLHWTLQLHHHHHRRHCSYCFGKILNSNKTKNKRVTWKNQNFTFHCRQED